MIRNRGALFISFSMHASIAVLAVLIFQLTRSEMPVLEKKISLSLTHYVKPLPVVLKAEPVRQKPVPPVQKPKPEPKVVEKVEPVKPEPKIVEKVEPEPVVVQEVLEPEPVIEEVVEEQIEPVVAEAPVIEEVIAEAIEVPVVASAPPPSAEEAYMREHLAMIAELLKENLYYPRIARKRGITGEVIVAFTLHANGEVTKINVKSGERKILNKAAIATIERLSGRFPKPGVPITLNVPISYRLQ